MRVMMKEVPSNTARLAQSVERKALNLVVVGSSPTVGAFAGSRPETLFGTILSRRDACMPDEPSSPNCS